MTSLKLNSDLNIEEMFDDLKPDIDYYMSPDGYRILTKKFLSERGYCCGNGCKHCPYFPKHTKGNRTLKE